MTIDVILIDDHDLFREGIAAILSYQREFRVLAQGSTSDDAVRLTRRFQPHFLLLDVELHGDPAYVTVRRLMRVVPDTRIVVLTMHGDSALSRQLIEAGAYAFFTKAMPSSDLIQQLRAAATTLGSSAAKPQSKTTTHDLLSQRELQVLRLVARARTNSEIATELSITEGTVKRHNSNIFGKLSAKSRMQAVRNATTLGLIGVQARVKR